MPEFGDAFKHALDNTFRKDNNHMKKCNECNKMIDHVVVEYLAEEYTYFDKEGKATRTEAGESTGDVTDIKCPECRRSVGWDFVELY